ncbi:hypothetical protein [Priestia megaterium]|uniref:hypothetical protein n=1 Tax=Priestia megaterium TaxID=1404 RepID=UPI00367347A4
MNQVVKEITERRLQDLATAHAETFTQIANKINGRTFNANDLPKEILVLVNEAMGLQLQAQVQFTGDIISDVLKAYNIEK